MSTTDLRTRQSTVGAGTLFAAFELGAREWRVAYTRGLGAAIRVTALRPGDRAHLRRLLAHAKAECGLAATAEVQSCYEAGRDGFWVHRWLATEGVTNLVVDSASIEVSRRARRTKTDRLDARKLVTMLVRWALGDARVWQQVHVPSVAVEAERRAPRLRRTLTKERTRWRNRIHAALATVGLRLRLTASFPTQLAAAQQWDGTPVPAAVQEQVLMAWRLLQQIQAERQRVAQTLRAARRAAQSTAAQAVATLTNVRGIGEPFAWLLATEVCSRDLRNRRQVGALTGFTPTHYQSGEMAREQGISRAGLPGVRALAVETAWAWVRWQPHSALTQWYLRRFGRGGPSQRKIGIVALARKLVIALWRYVREGTPPQDAVLRSAIGGA